VTYSTKTSDISFTALLMTVLKKYT
jgi:hypothetical protein